MPKVISLVVPGAVAHFPGLIAAYEVMVGRLEQVPLCAHQHYGISLQVGNLLFSKI